MTKHIGFDAKRALFNATGLGNYSRVLLQALSHAYPEQQYYLYVPSDQIGIDAVRFQLSDNMHLRPPRGKIARLLGGTYWRSMGMTSQFEHDALAVYHGLTHELPVNIERFKGKKVVTIHDLLPWRYPQQYALADRILYRYKWRAACDAADVVVAISEQSKQDLMQFLNVSATKIQVIPPPVDPMYYDYGDGMFLQHGLFVQQTYEIPYPIPNDYVLYVGSITERKNLLHLLRAVEKGLDLPLVVVGKGKGKYFEEVQAYVQQHGLLNKKVFFLPDVAAKHLPAIYRCAKALVHPSVFEGFGLPIAEALLSRIPVVACTGAGFEEVGGKGAVYVPSDDLEALRSAINSCISDHNLRISLIVAGWQHAQAYKAEAVAAQMMEIYTQ